MGSPDEGDEAGTAEQAHRQLTQSKKEEMAEGVGFEPTEAGLTTSPAFEAGPFIRSGTPPRLCDQLQVPPILALSSRVPRGICFSPRLRASVVRQRLFFCFLCFLCSLTPATEAGKVIDQGEGRWIGNVLCGDFC